MRVRTFCSACAAYPVGVVGKHNHNLKNSIKSSGIKSGIPRNAYSASKVVGYEKSSKRIPFRGDLCSTNWTKKFKAKELPKFKRL